ncbi:MAG: hypothetical protein ACXWFX_01310 [Methylobacter sp.]
MIKIHLSMLPAVLALIGSTMSFNVNAEGVTPVTTGAVVRGVNAPGPVGAPGTSAGKTCDFSREEVNQAGNMTGASVNCQANGTTAQVLVGLPATFNAYCFTKAPPKSARLLKDPVSGNANHCDLSGITPKDATGQFGGAVWR